jgi:potassium-transporting ATPase potassium-binding subunit
MPVMTDDIIQFMVYLVVLTAGGALLGGYMARVFTRGRTLLDPVLRPIERLIYRLTGVDEGEEMTWWTYAAALLMFHVVGGIALYLQLRWQDRLPLNPQGIGPMPPALALNTAVSFLTNTNWQAYSGETAATYLTQMAGLAVHNFLSAATGLCVALALIRGLTRRTAKVIGNFWVDLTRSVLWVLLPLSLVFAPILVSRGVIQNFHPAQTVQTLEAGTQTLPMGPVASQEAIKELGTNGGGFFGANSAHPYENPTPLTSFLEVLAILIIPVGLTFTFGHMAGDKRQGYAVLAAMMLMFIVALAGLYAAETVGNPLIAKAGVSGATAMEGKEVRFGLGESALFATVTTATSCGAVNTMHDSLTPLGGMVPMLLIMLGEVVFGGVGAGMYGVLIFVILTVFIAGLMVGRTPEYLGKKIESREMKLAVIIILIPAASILLGAAVASVAPAGLSSLANAGPHGLSEMLYAFASATGNNGSAFAGLNADTGFYDLLLALAMLIGRLGVIVPTLAVAGSLAQKRSVAASSGTFPTTTPLFAVLLASVVLIVGALTFFPALALGPVLEHLLMFAGRTF